MRKHQAFLLLVFLFFGSAVRTAGAAGGAITSAGGFALFLILN